jgi:hypothetical protein
MTPGERYLLIIARAQVAIALIQAIAFLWLVWKEH